MSFSQRDYKGTDSLILESVLGFRQWTWRNNKLHSMKRSDWSKGNQRAVCLHGVWDNLDNPEPEHEAPHPDCSCGIYAHYLPLESYHSWSDKIYGVIEASGSILMGTKGFRAEKAKIVALAGLGSHNEWFEVERPAFSDDVRSVVDFCTSIGVPYFSTVEQMVFEFPQMDLSSLGVSEESLHSWRTRRDFAKEEYALKVRRQEEFLASQKLQEEELFRRYGVKPGEGAERFVETFRHLGGFK